MTTLITAVADGLLMQTPHPEPGKTGRWAKPPQEPSDCYFCLNPDLLKRRPAVGYVLRDGWRLGVCRLRRP